MSLGKCREPFALGRDFGIEFRGLLQGLVQRFHFQVNRADEGVGLVDGHSHNVEFSASGIFNYWTKLARPSNKNVIVGVDQFANKRTFVIINYVINNLEAYSYICGYTAKGVCFGT